MLKSIARFHWTVASKDTRDHELWNEFKPVYLEKYENDQKARVAEREKMIRAHVGDPVGANESSLCSETPKPRDFSSFFCPVCKRLPASPLQSRLRDILISHPFMRPRDSIRCPSRSGNRPASSFALFATRWGIRLKCDEKIRFPRLYIFTMFLLASVAEMFFWELVGIRLRHSLDKIFEKWFVILK